jgi:hypothetical protein
MFKLAAFDMTPPAIWGAGTSRSRPSARVLGLSAAASDDCDRERYRQRPLPRGALPHISKEGAPAYAGSRLEP